MKLQLIESQASDRYEREYSDIPFDIFTQICAMDPTSIFNGDELMRIGLNCTPLLFPAYRNGEDFLDLADKVKSALTIYNAKRREYENPAVKNLSNFKSVEDFLDFVEDPDSFEYGKLKVTDNQVDKLTQIYNKFYAQQIPDRAVFDTIIRLDPSSSDDKIGDIAKNLLLPKYIAGEKDFLDKGKELQKAIEVFKKGKAFYDEDHKNIQKYESIEDFINYNLDSTDIPDSPLTADLKNRTQNDPNSRFSQYRILAQTPNYDIIQPLTREAASVIAGGGWDSSNSGGHWCTSSLEHSQYWNDYVTRGRYDLYDFMKRGGHIGSQNRRDNMQISVDPREHSIQVALNGNDSYTYNNNYKEEFKGFLKAHPDVFLAIKDLPEFKDIPEVQEIVISAKYAEEPLIINDYRDLKQVLYKSRSTLSSVVQEIVVNNIPSITAMCFAGFNSLKKLTIGPGVKIIQAQAFKNCSNLKEVHLEEVEEIGYEAFAYCSTLDRLDIPASLKVIRYRAFVGDDHIKLILQKKNYQNNPDKKIIVDEREADWYKAHFRLA